MPVAFLVSLAQAALASANPPEPSSLSVHDLVNRVALEDAVASDGRIAPSVPPEPPHRPIGDVRGLFRSDDFPLSALLQQHQGTVVAQLAVNERGTVDTCAIATSSGHEDLDANTCSILKERASFAPARDAQGRAVAGTYTTPPIRWEMPARETHPMPLLDRRELALTIRKWIRQMPLAPYRTIARFGPAGRIEACRHEQQLPEPVVRPCAQEYAAMHFTYAHFGKSIPQGTVVMVEGLLVDLDGLPERSHLDALHGDALFEYSVETQAEFPLLHCLSPDPSVPDPDACAERILAAGSDPAPTYAVTLVRRLAPEETPDFTPQMVR